MRIQSPSYLYASESLAVGRVPFGLRLNGSPVIDAAQLFRAAYATVYGRGLGPVELSFGVWRFFSTEAAALSFALTHPTSLVQTADLTLVDDAATVALTMAGAVIAAQIGQRLGLAVLVQYTVTGARFLSDDVPEAPTDSDTVKALLLDLTAGEESKAFTWDTPFASIPRDVVPALRIPTGGAGFHVWLIGDVTAEGGTVGFGEPVPASPAGYKLSIGGRL